MWREEGRSREWESWKRRREDERGRREEWEGLDMGGLRESPCSVRALGRGGCPQHGREGRREEERRGKCCEGGGGGGSGPRRRDCSLHGGGGSHCQSNVSTGSPQVSSGRYIICFGLIGQLLQTKTCFHWQSLLSQQKRKQLIAKQTIQNSHVLTSALPLCCRASSPAGR